MVRDLAQFPFFTETGYGMGEWILTLLNSVDMVEKGILSIKVCISMFYVHIYNYDALRPPVSPWSEESHP